jgi:hypothetical protein
MMVVAKIKEQVELWSTAGAKALSNVMPREQVFIAIFGTQFVEFQFVRPLNFLLNQGK